jgi:hypothetical protein
MRRMRWAITVSCGKFEYLRAKGLRVQREIRFEQDAAQLQFEIYVTPAG